MLESQRMLIIGLKTIMQVRTDTQKDCGRGALCIENFSPIGLQREKERNI
jgi:hypothetical protein